MIEVTEPVITTPAVAEVPSYNQSTVPTVEFPAVWTGYAVAEDLPAFSD